MRAVCFDAPGGPDVLQLRELANPVAGEGELLIRVVAAGINGADLNLRSGKTRAAQAPGRPGLEVSGVVEAIGPGVDAARSPGGTTWEIGDRICALVAGGGYAERVVAPVEQCLPPPEGFDPIEAAGVIETAATVWDNVFLRGRLAAGEVLLVHGGASGIGTTAIQLARIRGARVFATARSRDKCAIATELGAEACFNYREEDFVAALAARSGGADVILDVAGGSYLARNLEALKPEGRLVVIATNAGTEAVLDFRALMAKRASVMGSILKTRSLEEKRRLLADVWREVWPLYASRKMRLVVGRVVALADAPAAHAYMESGEAFGKMILAC